MQKFNFGNKVQLRVNVFEISINEWLESYSNEEVEAMYEALCKKFVCTIDAVIDDHYYDVKLPNGVVLEGLSSYHITLA